MVANYPRRPISSDTKDDYGLPSGEWNVFRIAVTAVVVTLAILYHIL